jgi:16S rRNA (cytidine1402-2'-O)-methyltransferase
MVQYPSLGMPGSLYVVSTPIGNLDDITLRALNTLKSVRLIAAEDTRRTAILLRHFGIATPTTSFHEHNEQRKLPSLLEQLAAGSDIALVSDAGTPTVADPGQRLISAAVHAGIRIVPIPGASAVLAALAVSGVPGDEFIFAGFAPSRSNERKRWLRLFINELKPIVFFETPHRIKQLLRELPEILGDRPIIIARELTKVHEEVIRTTTALASKVDMIEKGEFALILAPQDKGVDDVKAIDEPRVVQYFHQMTKNSRSRREALAATGLKFGLSTKVVYRLIERLKNSPVS